MRCPTPARRNTGSVGRNVVITWAARPCLRPVVSPFVSVARAALVAGALQLAPRAALGSMDIANNGPVLDAGRFSMRVTNVGVIGNAFFNKGLSFDPSFEFPKGSGHECLEHAELWVGATRDDGTVGVSGGPMLEFRPTLDPNDVVRQRYAGDRGTRALYDDDGDGRLDEELLDGIDNDGDGEIDEDLRFPAQETCTATYVDDRPEAVNFAYEFGERHAPLGLTVTQEAHAWALLGYDDIAGVQYTITNHGQTTLHDVWLGVFANLDARERDDSAGHLNDRVSTVNDSMVVFEGRSYLVLDVLQKDCFSYHGSELPAVHDGVAGSHLPWVAITGLSHTTDPLGYLVNYTFPGARESQAKARAPRRDTTFRYSVFSLGEFPGEGGPPTIDADRYAALRGTLPTADTARAQDYAVLASCGPFATLAPGQSLEMAVAFVAGENRDSLVAALQSALMTSRGTSLDLQPNASRLPGMLSYPYQDGRTGVSGHEVCYEAPEGVQFNYDPHCITKFYTDRVYYPPLSPPWPPGFAPPTDNYEFTYRHGQPCVWSDLDCDACTGLDGKETHFPWFVQAPVPPQPSFRSVAGDREVTVEWDNLPELLADAGVIPGSPWKFWGYRVYRLDQWARTSLLPPASRWQQLASFSADTSLGANPLSAALDPTVDYDSVAYERRHYPVGRYRFVDKRVMDGFDYHYVVTAVAQREIVEGGVRRADLLESPFRAVFSGIVRPRIEAGGRYRDGRVWVVPNPFRERAPWERESVPGDAFTRHVDFFGLPRARSRIRIYTLAGDLVRTLDHDGTNGDGEAAWNLISRNGQDIESGVYLFTVDWPGGHEVGRFVIIR